MKLQEHVIKSYGILLIRVFEWFVFLGVHFTPIGTIIRLSIRGFKQFDKTAMRCVAVSRIVKCEGDNGIVAYERVALNHVKGNGLFAFRNATGSLFLVMEPAKYVNQRLSAYATGSTPNRNTNLSVATHAALLDAAVLQSRDKRKKRGELKWRKL